MKNYEIHEDYFVLKKRMEESEKRIAQLENIIKKYQKPTLHNFYWTLQKIKIILVVLFYFFGKQLLLNKEFYKLLLSLFSLLK